MFDNIEASLQNLKISDKEQKDESIHQDSQESFKHQKSRLISIQDSENQKKHNQQKLQIENNGLKQDLLDELDEYRFKDQKQKQRQPFQAQVREIKPEKQIHHPFNNKPKKPNMKQPQLKEAPAIKVEEEQIYDNTNQNDFQDSTPDWAQPGKSRDKQMKLHGTSEADQATLYIPPKDFNKLTECKKQYWRIKSENFDKVIFFKSGLLYELYYEDAAIGNKFLDLAWIQNNNYIKKKIYTGCSQKNLKNNIKILVELGFVVGVVDEIDHDNDIERVLTQVITKGSYLYEDEEQQPLDDRYILAIRKNIINDKNSIEEYGIAMLERQTNQITLNYIQCEDDSYNELKTFILQIKPIEVIIDPLNICQNDPIYRMIKSQVIMTVIRTVITKNNNWDYENAMMKIKKVKGEENLPQPILYFKEKFIVNQALSGLITFLEQILIFERVVGCATFEVYDRQHSLQSKMIIDSQALQHLEILQFINPLISQKDQKDQIDYSLFSVINKTSTPGGHRLLKQWLCAPLYNLDQINERQLAVQDMSANKRERNQMNEVFKKYPDFQRTCSRIYEYSIKVSQKAVFFVYYEEISKTKLKQFKKIIYKFREAYNDIQRITDNGNLFISRRLKILTNQNFVQIQGQIGQLPNINQYLDEFDNFINFEEMEPKPVRGVIPQYDQMCDQVQEIKDRFKKYISDYRKFFNDYKNVNYSHAKFRYEIEVPEVYVSRQKPEEFEFTSARQGFKRYRTKFLNDLAAELEEAEFEQNKSLKLFVQVVFGRFKDMQPIWDKFINVLNELDAICSISTYGDSLLTWKCWPKFVNCKPHLFIKNGKHPQLNRISLIPNTVDIGFDNENFILITGPNMGGKSTILRMTCVLTILAQMGSQVPCEYMELTPVDMIFTRMGAYDKEALQPLKIGTENSLFIADELGRGTSACDGIAIAYGIMRYITEKLKCRTMFATHYRILVEEAKLVGQITNMQMACMEEDDCVICLYKLILGECPKSYGINLAKIVGINNSIIQKAEIKSMEYEQNSRVKAEEEIIKNFNILLSDLLQ